jgi:chromosome segregation ATPase
MELETLRKTMHSKSLELNDVLTEAEGLAEHYHGRNRQLEVLREHGKELREAAQGIGEEGKRLQGQKGQVEGQLGQLMVELAAVRGKQEASQKQLAESNASKCRLLMDSERLESAIIELEEINNLQDAEVVAALHR